MRNRDVDASEAKRADAANRFLQALPFDVERQVGACEPAGLKGSGMHRGRFGMLDRIADDAEQQRLPAATAFPHMFPFPFLVIRLLSHRFSSRSPTHEK
ncbi:hypothetical protein D3C76_1340850 [compost metagenome]